VVEEGVRNVVDKFLKSEIKDISVKM